MGCRSSRCASMFWSCGRTASEEEDGTNSGDAVDDVDVELGFEGPTAQRGVHLPHPPPSNLTIAGTAPQMVERSPHGRVHRLLSEREEFEDAMLGGAAEAPPSGTPLVWTDARTPWEEVVESNRNSPHRIEDSMLNVETVGSSSSSSTEAHAHSFPLLVAAAGSMSPNAASPHQHGRAAMLNNSARIKTSMNDSNESPNRTTIHHVPTFPRVASLNIMRQGPYAMELVDETTTPLGSVDRASRRSTASAASPWSHRSVSRQGGASPRQGRSLHSSPLHHGRGFVQATFLRADDDAQESGRTNPGGNALQVGHNDPPERAEDSTDAGNPLSTPHRSLPTPLPLKDALALM